MPETTDDNAGTTPGETPTMPQTYAAPVAGAHAPSGLRKHWGLIVGAVAIAILLMLAGVAIGAAVDGRDGRGGFGDGDGPRGQMMNGRGGSMMNGQGGPMMNGRGGFDGDCPRGNEGDGGRGYDGDCPRGYDGSDSGYGPGNGPANGQPCPRFSPAPDTSPGQSTTPQSL